MDKPLFSKDAMQQAVPHDMQTRYRAAVEAIPPDDPILELIYAAQMLHDECAEYGRINLLGGYDNRSMVRIRAAINHAWRTPSRNLSPKP